MGPIKSLIKSEISCKMYFCLTISSNKIAAIDNGGSAGKGSNQFL